MSISEFGEEGPLLAVLDGRFLPADYFSLNVRKDIDTVRTAGGFHAQSAVKSQTVEISFRTSREPQPRRAAKSYLTIRNRNERIRFEDVTVIQAPLDTGYGNTWEVDVSAREFEITRF